MLLINAINDFDLQSNLFYEYVSNVNAVIGACHTIMCAINTIDHFNAVLKFKIISTANVINLFIKYVVKNHQT